MGLVGSEHVPFARFWYTFTRKSTYLEHAHFPIDHLAYAWSQFVLVSFGDGAREARFSPNT